MTPASVARTIALWGLAGYLLGMSAVLYGNEVRAEFTLVNFEFAPAHTPVRLGSDIRFAGSFEIGDPAARRQLRQAPLVIEWRIVKRGTAIAILHGSIELRGARTPLLIRTRPAETGEYELNFELPSSPGNVALQFLHAEYNRIVVADTPPR